MRSRHYVLLNKKRKRIGISRRERRRSNQWESLEDRRTATAELKNIKPGLRDDCFFSQHADRGENRPDVSGTDGGAGAVRRHANRTGGRFGLAGVIVGRLRRRRPQHQGQAEPRRPAIYRTHALPHQNRRNQSVTRLQRLARAMQSRTSYYRDALL